MKSRSFYILFATALCVAGSVSCKKFIEKQKEKAAQNIITDGTWRVSRYQDGDSIITNVFSRYQFRFLENGTVDGVTGTDTQTGTWSVDINARTILASFPADQFPVNRLNHTWKIKDSYNDSVSANTVVDSATYFLELHKN